MIRAVLFDMFETLVTHYRSSRYFGEDIAKDLGLAEDRFREIWDPTERARSVGAMTFEETIRLIMEKNGIFSEALLEQVTEKRMSVKRDLFQHMHGEILPVLDTLRERKIKTALISNCFSEEVAAIRESDLFPRFDAVMLSYEQGVMKPDKEIFLRCLKKLSVLPEECLYVGDGGSRELETASELGMKALQATWYFPYNQRKTPEYKEGFPRLDTPSEILNYLG